MEGTWKKNTNQKSNPNIDNLLEKSEGKFYFEFSDLDNPFVYIYDGIYLDDKRIDLDIQGGELNNSTMIYSMNESYTIIETSD